MSDIDLSMKSFEGHKKCKGVFIKCIENVTKDYLFKFLVICY